MSLDEPRGLGAPTPGTSGTSRSRLVAVRLAVVAGSFVLCAAVALSGAAAARGDAAALAAVGWAVAAAFVTALGGLWWRDRRHAERRRRFEEWWTQVAERQGFVTPEDPGT